MTKSAIWKEIEKAAADLDGPSKEQKRDKLLETDKGRELRAVWDAADSDDELFAEIGEEQLPGPSPIEKMHHQSCRCCQD